MKWLLFCFFFVSILLFSTFVGANTYLNENITWENNLTNVTWASLVFGDIDGNGGLDLILTGQKDNNHALVYINNGTGLIENSTWQQNLTGVNRGSSTLGDLDNDGDLDLISTGCSNGGGAGTCNSYHAFVYINNGTSLIENSTWQQNLTGIYYGSIALGDLNNDGKLDLVLTGASSITYIAKVYINNGTNLVENSTWQSELTGVYMSSIVLGDLNNDNKLDLVLTGSSPSLNAKVYINNGTCLVRNSTWDTNLLAVEDSSVTLGDIDNDGDLDLSLIGHTTGDRHRIYNNTGNTFGQIQQDDQSGGNLVGIFDGSQAFGDYDNDGDLDLITTGYEYYTTLYLYNVSSNLFTGYTQDPEDGIKDLGMGSTVVWSDLDNDNDLDLIITGVYHPTLLTQTIVYLNNITTKNTKPNPPTILNATYQNGQLTLNWNNGSDTETTALGLYYNLRVGNSSSKNRIVSGVYGGGDDNGYFGNMMQRKSITLSVALSYNETIFWSVQTIDTALANGSWSVEQNYTIPIDTTSPTVTLNSPANGFNTSNTTITFNATVYDDLNLTNVSIYGNWSGTLTLNETNSSGINNSVYLFTINLSSYGDGVYSWLIAASDNANHTTNSSTRSFRIDTTKPAINLSSPANASSWTSSGTVTFTYNVTDAAIVNCSLIINDAVDQTDSSITVNTAQTFSKSLSNAAYNWSINCTDYLGLQNNSETRTLTVSYTAPSSGGVGSGGSSGGSSTTTETVRVSANAGESETVSFTKEFGITEIALIPAEKLSSVSITVEEAKAADSAVVSAGSTGSNVYKYLKITSKAEVEEAKIKFKVSLGWFVQQDYDENKVTLMHYTDKWESLPTTKAGKDLKYAYYEAETTGFSLFAITAEKKVEETAITKIVVKEEIIENATEEIAGNVTEEPAENITAVKEEVVPEKDFKLYILLIAVIIIVGLGYLVYYKMKHKKRQKKC